jgi:predicted metal-dependent phosphotriesterase family hydrolase
VTVQTVLGPRAREELGTVLPHEHLVIDYGELTGDPAPLDDETRAACAHALAELRADGVGTLVDCTPPGYGRRPALLAELSSASGVGIVMSTGSFCEQWSPQPERAAAADVAELADWFVRELDEGVEGAGFGFASRSPRAGVIKAATSQDAIRPNEDKLLRAAARAHRATGAAIVSHTTAGLGLEQLDLYEAEGADPTRVLISHVGFEPEPEPYAVQIAKRGAFVGLDRVGHHHFHPDEHWIRLASVLADAGHLDRILLSHDSVQRFTGPAEIAAHTFSAPWYVTRTLLPKLRAAGFDDDDLRRITAGNPARWLTGEE